jgi:hypothetical protein
MHHSLYKEGAANYRYDIEHRLVVLYREGNRQAKIGRLVEQIAVEFAYRVAIAPVGHTTSNLINDSIRRCHISSSCSGLGREGRRPSVGARRPAGP